MSNPSSSSSLVCTGMINVGKGTKIPCTETAIPPSTQCAKCVKRAATRDSQRHCDVCKKLCPSLLQRHPGCEPSAAGGAAAAVAPPAASRVATYKPAPGAAKAAGSAAKAPACQNHPSGCKEVPNISPATGEPFPACKTCTDRYIALQAFGMKKNLANQCVIAALCGLASAQEEIDKALAQAATKAAYAVGHVGPQGAELQHRRDLESVMEKLAQTEAQLKSATEKLALTERQLARAMDLIKAYEDEVAAGATAAAAAEKPP
jgi:hypothetical protein